MRPILKQLATLIGKSLNDRVTPLEARISALEAKAGIQSKAGIQIKAYTGPTSTEMGLPTISKNYSVGDVVKVNGGSWKCTGTNRWTFVA